MAETFTRTTSQEIQGEGTGFLMVGPRRTTETRTDSKRILTRREKFDKGADGILGRLANADVIVITLLLLSLAPVLSSPISQPQYLKAMYPNYQTVHENNVIADPYAIDYIQYGDQAVGGIVTFVESVSAFGEGINAGWTYLMNLFKDNTSVGGFATTFGSARWDTIISLTGDGNRNIDIFNALTGPEKTWVTTNVSSLSLTALEQRYFYQTIFHLIYFDTGNLFGGGVRFFVTEPSVYDIIP